MSKREIVIVVVISTVRTASASTDRYWLYFVSSYLDGHGVARGLVPVGAPLALGLVVGVAPDHHHLLIQGGVEGGPLLEHPGVAQASLLHALVDLALGDHARVALGLRVANLAHPKLEPLAVLGYLRLAQLRLRAPLLRRALGLAVPRRGRRRGRGRQRVGAVGAVVGVLGRCVGRRRSSVRRVGVVGGGPRVVDGGLGHEVRQAGVGGVPGGGSQGEKGDEEGESRLFWGGKKENHVFLKIPVLQ